jgi:multiple sugar transport system substrate-binding protein
VPAAAASPGATTVTIGSGYSAQTEEQDAFAAMVDWCAGQTQVPATITTYDNVAYQSGIEKYLRGTPDDIFTRSAAYPTRILAAEGLLADASSVWATAGSGYTADDRAQSTGWDGRPYFVPIVRYPWAIVYRKTVFAQYGYQVPKTMDEFVALAKRMQRDGLVPLAFGDQDGWPAMGWFDILDMRMNGYDFHERLLAGTEKWTDPRVKAVFAKWAGLLPYVQDGAESRAWSQAAQDLYAGRAGMYLMGSFAMQVAVGPVRADLDMFPFPVLGNQWDTENAIDSPIDGVDASRRASPRAAVDRLLACLASGPAQAVFASVDRGVVAVNTTTDTSGYTDYQKRASQIIAGAGRKAEFLDRETRPDFAGPDGMQAFLLDFIQKPDQDLDAFLRRVQAFRDALPPLLRSVAALTSSTAAMSVPKGTAVTFTTTVRPVGPTPATVRFAIYRRVGSGSRLVLARDVDTDAAGRAALRYTFRGAGSFYVRSRVLLDPTYYGTTWTAPRSLVVR